MKFSYSLLKQLVPEIKNKAQAVEALSLHAFEAEDKGGDVLEISIPPNRFSDAASHWGIARELSAIRGKKLKDFEIKVLETSKVSFDVEVKEPELCGRALAQYFEKVKIGPSPRWMQDVLVSCGMRPINNLVDITNYVMLEVGQPLHSFDADKMDGEKLIIRRAVKDEDLETLDARKFKLDKDVLVLADRKNVLDVAGIKGGKKAEIDKKTKNILLTSCSFKGINIYKTSKKLNLTTEASVRFSHNLSPALAEQGIRRAAELILALCGGKPGKAADRCSVKQKKIVIPFSFDKFEKLIGSRADAEKIEGVLKSLGFDINSLPRDPKRIVKDKILVTPPVLRADIQTFEDVAEEAARILGLNSISSWPPRIHLLPSGFEDQIMLKDKIRNMLVSFGLSEIYGYSFISKADGLRFGFNNELVELQNPISDEFNYLRPSLAPGLLKSALSNMRFFDTVRIFEIGKIFFKDRGLREKLVLGILFASKSGDEFSNLKGLVNEFLKRVGLSDFSITGVGKDDWVRSFSKNYISEDAILKLESGKDIFGYMGQLKPRFGKWKVNACEIDLHMLLQLISAENEYRPLSKFPSIMRDISIVLSPESKVGPIVQSIQEVDLNFIRDVDILDEYKNSITFRIVFQAEDRTLTDREVNALVKKIEMELISKFKAQVR